MNAEQAEAIRRMGVEVGGPACQDLMLLRWRWYYLSGVASRLYQWRHPAAGKWEAWARHLAREVDTHIQTCPVCVDMFGGATLLVIGE